MTDKTKMSNLESYTELSIQIATLDMKLNKVLELLNKPEVTTNHPCSADTLDKAWETLFKNLITTHHNGLMNLAQII